MHRFKAVLFDLDGTLINSNKLVIASFQHTFRKHLGREVPERELIPYLGEPLKVTLSRYNQDEADEMLLTYRRFNLENHDRLTTLIPKTKQILYTLKRNGLLLGLVTAKIGRTAIKGLELFSLKHYFNCIITAEDTKKGKPHPEPLLHAMSSLAVSPAETLYIGDSPFDVRAARSAGVSVGVVSWSMHPQERLLELGAREVIKDPADIFKIVGIPEEQWESASA